MLLPLHLNGLNLDSGTAVATISGTAASGLTETQVRDGGETIIITLTNDTWVAAGATFDAERQNIIDGLDSAQSETTGWNNEVRDNLSVTTVVRTSDTVVTITLSAQAAYDITANETITVTVPASALVTSSTELTASPTFEVTADAAVSTGTFGGSAYPKKKRQDELKRLVEQFVDEAVSEEVSAREDESDPPPKITKAQTKRITASVIEKVEDSDQFRGRLNEIEEQVERFVNANLAQRRIERRRKLRLAQRTIKLDELREIRELMMQSEREEQEIITIISMILMSD